MEFYTNTEQVKKIAKKIINYSSDLKNYRKKLISIIEKIEVSWEGDDSLKYVSIMKEQCSSDLKKLSQNVEDYGKYLSGAAEVYSLLDEKFASKRINS